MAWKSTYCNYRKQVCLLLFTFCLLTASFAQTIFQPTDAPASPLGNDGQPIEVGVKFRASQNGYITGIRFYKGAGTTGSHIGQLWSSTGTLLASAPFTDESSSGWQQVLFDSPFAISVGVTYVAACYNSSGDYAVTGSFFSEPTINGPLKALADNEEGPNGVFIYSSIPMLPSNGFQANNYWVDVVFNANTGPDTFPPLITSVSPLSGETNISTGTTINVVFNEPMDASSISGSTFEIRDPSNLVAPATITFSSVNNTVTLTPNTALNSSGMYTVTVKGGVQGVKDIAGNALANNYTWSFTTADPPFVPPADGYGGPILVVSSAANPFSRYTVEILRAEGLNEFTAKDISTLTANDLTNYDVIILGETPVTSAQVTMLANWVNGGGTLIAFKPATSLSSLFGITATGSSLPDKYLLVNTTAGPGTGIVNQTIQYHGAADLYTLTNGLGATSLASIYSDATTATINPAITTRNVGTNGGKAIAFTYDLAKSIIYTRQGNPAWAGQKHDGTEGPVRSDDMFFPGWIDFNKIAIPQADEQQRLLANIILQGNLHRKPLPRLWYLPKGLKAAIVMTGDDHANNGTTGRFNQYLSLGPNTPQDVADWNAIRATSYIYANTPISNAQAVAFEAQGFEIALHPTTGCTDFTNETLESAFISQSGSFHFNFPDLPDPVTNRTHCMPWSDWATHPKVELNHGMRLDVNYYYWPDTWVQNRPGMFTGSGMPMRFADSDGTLIDCYQAPTQMTDESGIDIGAFCNSVLDKATGAEGYYGTFVANMHTDTAIHTGSNAIIASALAHKIPVISAKQLLNWTDGRNNSSFGTITWNNNQLDFSVIVPSGARNLNVMLPFNSDNGQLSAVTRNGSTVPFSIQTIKGIKYAFADALTGSNSFVAIYSPLPAITVQPQSQTICNGNSVSFISAAVASTVQWQQSTDGANWANINNATNDTLTFTPAISDNNKQYRAVWTNATGSLNTMAAILTVNPVPSLTSTLTPAAVNSGSAFTYVPAGSVTGTTFTWRRNAVTGITNPAANGTGNVNETLINNTDNSVVNVNYAYTLTANGCSNTQNVTVGINPPPSCINSTSIAANFNGTSISGGRYIWFNSVFKPANIANRTVNFHLTNGTISYTVNNQQVTLNVPDARIQVSPAVTTPTTQFLNNSWVTSIPASYTGNIFFSGLSYLVPSNLPGNIHNVTWSMNVVIDQPNVSLDWKWTAGVYTSFTGNAGLNVKPVDGILNILSPLLNLGNAGTPLNYTLSITVGAMGSGLLNITNTYSSSAHINCGALSRSVENSLVQKIQLSPLPLKQLNGKQSSSAIIEQQALTEQALTEQAFDVKVMPNPSTNYFNLVVSGDNKTPVSIRILDISGRTMEQYTNIAAGSVVRIGHTLNIGSYFAETIQGDQRKVIKLIKIKSD